RRRPDRAGPGRRRDQYRRAQSAAPGRGAGLDRSLMLRGLVRAGVVVGVEDRDWGQRVEALVTLEPGVEPEEAPALVRAALRTAEVPSQQIPKRVHVVEQLPLLGIGKIDRAAARALAAGRAGP